MFRLRQILQNTFIRIEAFFSVFFRNLFNFVGNIFAFLGKVLGFSNPGYFLDSNQAQSIKQETQEKSVEETPTKTSEASVTNRRRPNPQMDYYLKMAQNVKKK